MQPPLRVALERLEPYDGKLSRTVLRGKGAERPLPDPVLWWSKKIENNFMTRQLAVNIKETFLKFDVADH